MIGSSPPHVEVDALSQSDLAAGGTVNYTYYDFGGSSWRPVTMYDGTAGGPMWFVTEHGDYNSIDLERVDNILDPSNSSLHPFNVRVNPYNPANDVLNPNGTDITPGSNGKPDTRILKAAERYGDIVACQTVGVGSNEDDARWYQFDVTHIDDPLLVQWGNVGFGANTYTVYPAIDINPVRVISMGFTKVGNDTSTDYMSTYITGQLPSDPLNKMEPSVEVKAGDSNNTDGRMGDFSGINIDPTDGTFWVADEYTSGNTSYQEIANFAVNLQNFNVVNGQLQIYGDQEETNGLDTITIDVNGRGGVSAQLNGELASFDPGQITSIYINPGGGKNDVEINNVPANCATFVDGPGVNIVTVGNGSTGVQGIQSAVFVYNCYPTPSSTGWTALRIDDAADSGDRSATLYDQAYGDGSYQRGYITGLAPAPIEWFDNAPGTSTGGVQSLYIYGGYGTNTFTVDNDGNLWGGTYLYSGSGFSTIYVQNTNGPLSLDGDRGTESVHVGNGGSMQGILGWVDVYNSSSLGYSNLYLDDSSDTTGRTVNMYGGSISGLAPAAIYWTATSSYTGGVQSLEVDGGSGGNTFNVFNTSNFYNDTLLRTGSGDDAVFVYATTGNLSDYNPGGFDNTYVGLGDMGDINGFVDVYGPGSTYLDLNDSNDTTGHTVSMSDGSISGLAPATIYWTATSAFTGGVNHLEVDGGSGGNTFNVSNTGNFDLGTDLNTGSGDDTVNVYATTGGLYVNNPAGLDLIYVGQGNMSNIDGFVNVYGNGETNLILDYSSDPTGRTAYLYNGEVVGLSPAPIFWSPTSLSTGGVVFLELDGGWGGNTFNVYNTSPFGYGTILSTGSGKDNVNVYATTGGLYIDNPGSLDIIDVGQGNMSNINGFINVYGNGETFLDLDDSSDTTGRTAYVYDGSIYGLAPATIYWSDNVSGSYDGGVDYLEVDGGLGGNTFIVEDTSNFYYWTLLSTGTGNDRVYVYATTGGLYVNNPGGYDSTDVGVGNTSNINGFVNVSGSGSTGLVVDDSSDSASRTATLTSSQLTGLGNAAAINYGSGVTSLSVYGGNGGNTFDVLATAALPNGTTLYGGTGGDTFNVGSAANTLDPLQGVLSINGQGANATLNIHDDATRSVQAYGVYSNQFTRTSSNSPNLSGSPPQIITYFNLKQVNVYGGSGADTWSVYSTASGTTTSLFSNGGTSNNGNEFDVENRADVLDDIQGPLAIHGHGAYDFANVYDGLNTVGHTYTLTTGMLQRDGIANITYDGIGEFILTTANNPASGHTPNTVNVQSLGNVFVPIVVGAGDTVTVGQNGSMANILGDVRIQSAAGQVPKQVILDDSADPNARTITLGSDPTFGYLVNGLANGFQGRGRIGLMVDPTTPVSILTGAGNDVISVHDLTNAPKLALDAGGGTNKLDYSAYKGTVKVNLPLGMATGFAGSIKNIENVTGGQGNNLLVGDANPNVLIGGTGRNVIIGGGGGDRLDTSAATSDNILIGGTTDYDTNVAALDAIFAEWTRTDLSFKDRFSDLTTGTNGQKVTPLNKVNGKLILLTNTTVHADTSPDTLIGSNQTDPATGQRVHNWFFYDSDDTLINFLSSSDHQTKVK
jgi:hypothetical protein